MKATKILSVFLSVVMLCSMMLASCGQTPEETTTSVTTEASQDTTDTETHDEVTATVETTDEQLSTVTEPKTDSSVTEAVTETESDSDETTIEATFTTETVKETTTDTDTETETDKETEDITEPAEETAVITDVMIGDTIDAEYAADFTVAKIFSDDMVVQRGEHIRVWGFAPESENGKKVSGEFKGMFAEALIENGEWCITFGARLEADTVGAEMKIYAGESKTVTFTGVLVGDVYLVMGQSNAAYEVSSHLSYTDHATQGGGRNAIDENSIIRLNNLNNSGGSYTEKGRDYVYTDLENTKAWTNTTQADTVRFSAVGYYFAKAMVEKTNNTVPVGLIKVAKGGAPIASFLPNELAEKHDTDYLNKATGKYLTRRSTEHQGRYLYNCYLAPVSRFAVAGAVWYQGESDNPLEFAMNYGEIFNDFIEHLRSTHNVINKDFPVFIAELAPIYKQPENYSGDQSWAYMETGTIRAYMGLIPSTVKNCYVGSGSDLWNDRAFWNNLHPNNKYELAGRLADIAEAVIFGKGSLDDATGPVYHSATISEDKKTAVIKFSNVGQGLTTADGGVAVQGIVGFLNKEFVLNVIEPVSATITGKDEITVVFDKEIKAVAYNYSTSDCYGDTLNLCNSAGIPAIAFITPFEERSLDNFTPDSFINVNEQSAKLKGKWMDSLSADGEHLFEVGMVENQLAAAGNKINIYDGTSNVNLSGWIGFRYEILMFGYSIDGGNAVLTSHPLEAGDAVLNAGGKNAKRFGVNIDTNELSLGEHSISLLALIDLKNGTVVEILSFTVTVVERPTIPEGPTTPEGLDLPMATDSGYGFVGESQDELKIDNTQLYFGAVNVRLEWANNKITVEKGAQAISYIGWIGFETTINTFGYAIDGNEPILETPTINAEQGVLDNGGANAKRYLINVDISELEVGTHVIDILVSINTKDSGEAVLKIVSFTLEIE